MLEFEDVVLRRAYHTREYLGRPESFRAASRDAQRTILNLGQTFARRVPTGLVALFEKNKVDRREVNLNLIQGLDGLLLPG